VRCRPLSTKEVADKREQIVKMNVREGQVMVEAPNKPTQTFTFDQVYDQETSQLEIFRISAQPIVESVLNGYNGTIFAYGQTGTGACLSSCVECLD
jgi:kinesin family protein 3/17